MTALKALFPRQANNDYRGGPVAFWGFCLLTAVNLFRSTVHFLKDDSGVNSIASIIVFPGTPDPNNVIYMFSSIGGQHQMIFTLLSLVVLWRYRSLIPMMLAFLFIESCFGFVVQTLHPLTPEFYQRTPPGKAGMVPKLVVTAALTLIAVRTSMRTPAVQRKPRAPA
jgi:hypothetical protein